MAAADVVGRMRVEIVGDNSRLDRSINDSRNSANNLGKTLKNMFKGIAVAAAIRAIAKVTTSLINAASDAEETRNKFEVVFGTVADAAKDAADRIKEEFKLSDETTEKFLSGVGDITSGLGATGEEALLAAEKITKLGLDIDSFANLSGGAEQAVKALTSLFTGEREAAKALGIVINDNNLKQFAEDSGLVFKNLTPLEKGFLSLELATSQSQLAIGDFTRSIDSFANQQKIAKSAVEDLQVAIGKNLLPAATDAIGIFGEWTKAVTALIDEHNILQEVVGRFEEDTDTAEDALFIAEKQVDIEKDRLDILKKRLEGLVVSSRFDEQSKDILEDQIASQKIQFQLASELVTSITEIVKQEGKVAAAIAEGNAELAAAEALEAERLKALKADTAFRIKIQNELKEAVDKINEAVIGGLIEGNGELEKEEALRTALLELIDNGFTAQEKGFANVIEFAKLLNIELEKEVEIIEFVNKRYQNSLEENQFAHSAFTGSVLEDNKEIALSTADMLDMSASLFDSFFSIVDTLTKSSLRNSLTAIDTLQEARLAAIDSDLAAALDAAGVSVETELERLEARLEAAKENGDAVNIAAAEDAITRLGIEDHFASAEQKILEDLAKEKRRLVHDAAVSAKVFGIIQAQISGFIGIAKALELPWPLNLVAAIATGAAATANTIAITAQPIPSFAQGGIMPGTPSKIDNMVAKVASGELIANQDQKDRMLMQFLNGGGSGGGTTVINAVIDKKVLFKVILDGSRQGTAQFASRGVIN